MAPHARSRLAVLPCLLLLATLLTAAAPGAPGARGDDHVNRAVRLHATVIARGLDHPWEVRQLPDGRLLVPQRNRRKLTVINPTTGSKRSLAFPRRRIWAVGETGLMGLEVDPAFAGNRRIYTCSGWRKAGGGHDVRVIAWTLDRRLTRARLVKTLRPGLPTAPSGQHGGCRLLITRSGSLLVGTGDGKAGWRPQSLRSFGGKVLRLDRFTGRPDPANRWAHGHGARRYVLTYGHRNVQGLAQRADGTLWSVEHGTDRDDEVNRLGNGHNYGWNPVPGYDQSTPMTDFSLPGKQYAARWRSRFPTIAPSGADFVPATGWGRYSGALAVAVLKGQRLMFVRLDRSGHVRWTRAPRALRHYGRLRSVHATEAGSLLVTTDNGDGRDVVLRVRAVS